MLELTPGKLDTIRLNGRTVKYRVRHSASAKRWRLRVSPGGVVVTIPAHGGEAPAELIRRNASWVTEELRALARRAQADDNVVPGASMLLRGKAIGIRVRVDWPSRHSRVMLQGNHLVLSVPSESEAPARLEAWLRQLARREVTAAIGHWAPTVGVKPRRIFIRGQVTKWGNCSRLRNLSFNWRLIMMPPEVLSYLVIHELVHLKEMSHSRRFWLLVQQACPEFTKHQEWLRANAHRLSLPDLVGRRSLK